MIGDITRFLVLFTLVNESSLSENNKNNSNSN